MKTLLQILIEEISTSIPTHNINRSAQKIYDILKKRYPNVPEYVIKDFLSDKDFSRMDDYEKMRGINTVPGYIKKPYKLQIINVNPEDFDETTIQAFIDREFGEENTYLVPDDEARMEYQKKIAKGDGKNEPIVVYRMKDGKYRLLEGWHRTMSLLKLGDNGEDFKNWDRVKIRAFVFDLDE